MLTSASDYKYQQTGNYDVTRTPVYASPSLAVARPLFYSDMLYLSEAHCVLTAAMNQSVTANYLLPYGDDLPLIVTTMLSQGMSPSLLLSFLRQLRTQTFTSAFTSCWLTPDATFGEYTVPYSGGSLFANAAFVADFQLPALDASTDWSPDSPGDPLIIDKYMRAWNAVAQMRRCFYQRFDLAYSRTTTTTRYQDGSQSGTPTSTTSSGTSNVAFAFGSSAGWSETYDRNHEHLNATESDVSASVTLPTGDFCESIDVNGLVCVVDGTRKTSYSGGESHADRIYIEEPVTQSGRNLTWSRSLTRDDALALATKLNLDTTGWGWLVSISPVYLDVTFTFRHEI